MDRVQKVMRDEDVKAGCRCIRSSDLDLFGYRVEWLFWGVFGISDMTGQLRICH